MRDKKVPGVWVVPHDTSTFSQLENSKNWSVLEKHSLQHLVFQLRKCWSTIGYHQNMGHIFFLSSTSKHHCELQIQILLWFSKGRKIQQFSNFGHFWEEKRLIWMNVFWKVWGKRPFLVFSMVPMLLDLSKVCFAFLILKDNLKIQLVSFYEVFLT